MGRYIARRLIQFIPVILGTMFLLHLLSVLTIQIVGDPVRALFGENAPPDEVIQQLQVAYNLDDPCLKDSWNPCFSLFVDRMGQYIQGDFGVNYQGRAVSELFLERIGVTLRLTFLAILIETIIGITLGVLAGLRKDKFIDNLVKVFTSVLVAFPTFVFGSLMLLLLGLKLGLYLRESTWAPEWLGQMFQVGYNPDYPWLSLFLPAVCLAAFSLAAVARLTRTSLIENLRSDYVRTARAKGLDDQPHHRHPHAAQLVDPGGDLHRHRHRRAARRRPGHRGHLQRPRHRAAGVHQRPGQRHPRHHRRGDDPGHRVPGGQPARRHPLRRTRPEDPL